MIHKVSAITTFLLPGILSGFGKTAGTIAVTEISADGSAWCAGCTHILDEGKLNSTQAATKAMEELTGPIVGEVPVLLSVFIPAAFISGITGPEQLCGASCADCSRTLPLRTWAIS